MADLISRRTVLELAYCAIKPNHDCPSVVSVVDVEDLEKLPAIDAVPVVHARWIAEYRTICSACKTQFDDDMFWIQGDFIKPNYCPNCGARMDGDADAAD